MRGELLPLDVLARLAGSSSGASLTGTTTAPSSSATMMSPGITSVSPQAIGTLTAKGKMSVWVWKFGVTPRSQRPRPRSLRLRVVADAAVDDHADAAAALEVGQHHLAEDAAAHVAARVHDHDVAGLRVVEDVPVQLLLGVGVLVHPVQVLALRHELERQRRADDRLARRPAT